jgi:hypothetical protein
LRAKQLPTHGMTEDLAKRLAQVDAQASAWGKKHLQAMDNFWEEDPSNSITKPKSNKRTGFPQTIHTISKRVRSEITGAPLCMATDTLTEVKGGSDVEVSNSDSVATNPDNVSVGQSCSSLKVI